MSYAVVFVVTEVIKSLYDYPVPMEISKLKWDWSAETGQVDPKGHRFPQDLRVLWNKTQTQSAVELSDSQEQTTVNSI